MRGGRAVLGNRLALQVGRRTVDGAHENVTLGSAAGRGDERRGAVLEPAVLENHQLARVQLLSGAPARRLPSAPIFSLIVLIQIRLGAVAFPVQDIEDNKLLLVLMWLRHDVGVCPEQIDPECASLLPPVFGTRLRNVSMRSLACGSSSNSIRLWIRSPLISERSQMAMVSYSSRVSLPSFHSYRMTSLARSRSCWLVTVVMPELADRRSRFPEGSSRTSGGGRYPIRWSGRSRAQLLSGALCVAPKLRSKLMYRPFMCSLAWLGGDPALRVITGLEG